MTTMNRFLTGMTLLALTGCGSTTSDQKFQRSEQTSRSQTESTLDGGITSGGGGAMEEGPAGAQRASSMVGLVPNHLKLFFNEMYAPTPGSGELKSKIQGIFGDDIYAVHQLIDDTPIEDQKDKPCFYEGQEADGAYSKKDGICISSFRLGEKLGESELYPQILALAVHELAHAMAATEDQCVDIQKQSFEVFKKVSLEEVEATRKSNLQALKRASALAKELSLPLNDAEAALSLSSHLRVINLTKTGLRYWPWDKAQDLVQGVGIQHLLKD